MNFVSDVHIKDVALHNYVSFVSCVLNNSFNFRLQLVRSLQLSTANVALPVFN